MSWSPDFVAALSAPSITPRYRVRFWRPSSNSVGDNVTLYSESGALRIGASGVRIEGTAVIPSRWSVSFGGFEMELVGDLRPYKDQIQRGALAIVECSFIGLTPYETIGLGQLDQISGVRGVYRVTFKDILSAFQNRIDTRYSTSLEYNKLFYTAGLVVRCTHTWVVGQTTLNVSNASIFEKQTGFDGVIFCVPASGSDPFYMRWSSADTTANTLTLTTGTASHPSTANASNLAADDLIYNCVRIVGTPFSFLARIVTSTGTGTNGPFDSMPANWSTGAPIPAAMYDYDDAFATRAYLKPSSGTFYNWDYVRKEPTTNGIRDVLNQLANAGQWPVFRQDSFSWRGCTDPTGQFDTIPPIVSTIRDADIIQIAEHVMHDPSLSAVYGSTKLIYDVAGNAETSTQSAVPTLPAQGQVSRDMGAIYDAGGDEEKMAEGDLKRLKIWDLYHWSRLTLRVSLKHAVLVAGDVVRISSAYLYDLSTQAGRTYSNRTGMIISTEYNISGRFCVIVIAIPPLIS